MKDRFTQASAELTDNNPYISTSSAAKFGHPTIGHIDKTGRKERHELVSWGADCILNCDPVPFGD